MDSKEQFASFFLDELLFGIPVENVQEIVGAVDMTPVPLAPPVVKGLINLRGQIVTAIDLRTCLQVGGTGDADPSVNVIVNLEGLSSLVVDRAGEIVEVDPHFFEPRPETLEGAAREPIRGTYKLGDKLMHVLDLKRTLQLAG